jgi:hypothetical protein
MEINFPNTGSPGLFYGRKEQSRFSNRSTGTIKKKEYIGTRRLCTGTMCMVKRETQKQKYHV